MLAFFSRCRTTPDNTKENQEYITLPQTMAPHAIPEGMNDTVCPVTGLSKDTAAALEAMVNDPDIINERLSYSQDEMYPSRNVPIRASQGRPTGPAFVRPAPPADEGSGVDPRAWTLSKELTQSQSKEQLAPPPFEFIPLNMVNGSHKANADTQRLVRSVGLPKLKEFLNTFYGKMYVDPHLDQFIRRHETPHGIRFATWIAEQFGDGTPWTEDRKTRPKDLVQIGGMTTQVAHDRLSSHFAAWHSHKRDKKKWGNRFQPDDTRVWMRVHFWAAREVGLFEPQYASFMDYYIRFIGHLINVYHPKSPPFTRESARWSADPKNIEQYLEAGRVMKDVIDMPLKKAVATLPEDERVYTGSKSKKPSWPYQNEHVPLWRE